MAALHAALFACELKPGAVVLASQDLYGATTNLLLTVFGSFGIKTVTADFNGVTGLREKALELKPRVWWRNNLEPAVESMRSGALRGDCPRLGRD
jgi:cystathionine beta-lyase/cystathionine gamma-synthase